MNDGPDTPEHREPAKRDADAKEEAKRDAAKATEEQEKREAEALDVILNDQLRVSAEAELKRADSVRQRASWLLGFSGVVLGLGGTQADELLKDSRELGSFGHIFAPVALGLAFVFVAAAAAWSLDVLFRSKGFPEFSVEEIENATSDEFVSKGKAYNQFRIAAVTQIQIVEGRKLNVRNNASLFYAFVALLIAVVFFILQAGVFLEDTVEGHVCPYAAEPVPIALSHGPGISFATLTTLPARRIQIVLERPKCPPKVEPVP
jgi:hypothetical protein